MVSLPPPPVPRTIDAMRRASIAFLVVMLSLLAALPSAVARDDDVRRRGDCELGSEWRLRVRRETPSTLRVRYVLDTDRAGETWSVFLSMNGSSLFTGTRTTASEGYIRIQRYPRDGDGDDTIKGSANNRVTGESCSGSLLYRF
jgi:hypothetical protein